MDAEFQCHCGRVRGCVADVAPGRVSRVTCYCDDCQAFLHQLQRADLLDALGGSDIVLVAPASISFLQGTHELAGLRLTGSGLYRWYSRCCRTPLGNTLGPTTPFVGINTCVFAHGAAILDNMFGTTRGAAWGKFAIGGIPNGMAHVGPVAVMRIAGLILGWRISGRTWPHPCFDRVSRKPKWPVSVLLPDARQALRASCGPNPSRRM
jgi:hypothetical protein